MSQQEYMQRGTQEIVKLNKRQGKMRVTNNKKYSIQK